MAGLEHLLDWGLGDCGCEDGSDCADFRDLWGVQMQLAPSLLPAPHPTPPATPLSLRSVPVSPFIQVPSAPDGAADDGVEWAEPRAGPAMARWA